MIRIPECLIAVALLSAQLYIVASTETTKSVKDFEKTLDGKQLDIYKIIKRERMEQYLMGTLLGILVAGIVLYYYKSNSACLWVSVVMIVSLIYYRVAPKTYYMANYLNNNTQIRAWKNVYLTMGRHYMIGMALGIVGYYLLICGLLGKTCNSK